jgi:eukaryotic-like serine/threonine-protein kinase
MTDSTTLQDLDAALGSRYIVVREMPQAAGFSTFAARDGDNGSAVEIKTLPLDAMGGKPPVSETELESRRIQHPNIVPIITAGSQGNTFFWISPEIEGRTLRARFSRGGKMGIRDSLTVLRDVSAGLTHAHLHGVVHGGLTPDSIIISGGSALVADLGVAEAFTALRLSHSGGRMSTPTSGEPMRYASPEQAGGGKADTRSDVYAWGVIAYELLGGRHPFAGRTTPREMMVAHSDEEPPALVMSGVEVPPGVTKLIMRCLSKDPARRPETARQVLDAITKEMLVPEPAPAAGSGQKAVMALLVIAVLALGIIAWMGMRS